jgi:hypothetical protein
VADDDRASDDPRLAEIARHALHDEELIAALAAGDVDGRADAERARALIQRCSTCRELHDDLTALRSAIQASGTAAQRAATTSAPRDFRLAAEDAARLRPGSPVARLAVRLGWRARIGKGIEAFGRPIGAAMATFGIVGLLIGSLTLGGNEVALMGGAAGASAVPGVDQNVSAPESTSVRVSYVPDSTLKSVYTQGGEPTERESGRGRDNVILLGGSLGLLVLGLGLILAARRNVAVPRPRGN